MRGLSCSSLIPRKNIPRINLTSNVAQDVIKSVGGNGAAPLLMLSTARGVYAPVILNDTIWCMKKLLDRHNIVWTFSISVILVTLALILYANDIATFFKESSDIVFSYSSIGATALQFIQVQNIFGIVVIGVVAAWSIYGYKRLTAKYMNLRGSATILGVLATLLLLALIKAYSGV